MGCTKVVSATGGLRWDPRGTCRLVLQQEVVVREHASDGMPLREWTEWRDVPVNDADPASAAVARAPAGPEPETPPAEPAAAQDGSNLGVAF